MRGRTGLGKAQLMGSDERVAQGRTHAASREKIAEGGRGARGVAARRRGGRTDVRQMTYQVFLVRSFFLGVEILFFKDGSANRSFHYTNAAPFSTKQMVPDHD
jgi:hypothetical protein